MLFKDIDIFVIAAQAILRGENPYLLSNVEVFYPLPFYFLFMPFVALPLPVVHVLWGGLNALIYVAILRRRSLAAVLSMQVLLTFVLGQVDLIMLGLFAALRSGIMGGVVLAFLVLKPQLVLLLAPWMLWRWWRRDRRQIIWFVMTLSTIAVAAFAAQPDWPMSLMARSGERVRAGISASVWGLLSFLPTPLWLAGAGLAAIVVVIWAWRKDDFDIVAASGLLISPVIFSYNLIPLILMFRDSRLLLGFTVLSWMAFGVAAFQSNDRASALLTIAVLIALVLQRRRRLPSRLGVVESMRKGLQT